MYDYFFKLSSYFILLINYEPLNNGTLKDATTILLCSQFYFSKIDIVSYILIYYSISKCHKCLTGSDNYTCFVINPCHAEAAYILFYFLLGGGGGGGVGGGGLGGSVVKPLSRDRRAVGLSLTCVTALCP